MRAGPRGAGSKAGVCELLLQDSRKFDGEMEGDFCVDGERGSGMPRLVVGLFFSVSRATAGVEWGATGSGWF